MLTAVLTSLLCCGCWGMPDWPADGLASEEWVEEALEWRLKQGVEDCDQEMLALDALSLEWIANSPEIRVEIRTEDWPFLILAPQLTAPLIQLHAWYMIRGEQVEERDVYRTMKRMARRSKTLRIIDFHGAFKASN